MLSGLCEALDLFGGLWRFVVEFEVFLKSVRLNICVCVGYGSLKGVHMVQSGLREVLHVCSGLWGAVVLLDVIEGCEVKHL